MFYRSINGIREEMPKAKAVVIPGYEDYHFFACRLDDPSTDPDKEYKNDRPKSWCVYTESTGVSLGWGDTQAKAIDYVKGLLDCWPRHEMEAILEARGIK